MKELPVELISLYRKHMASMGADERTKYEGKISSVEWNQEEQVYIVKFESGDWWHYDVVNNTWY
jgi:hypothetical protein